MTLLSSRQSSDLKRARQVPDAFGISGPEPRAPPLHEPRLKNLMKIKEPETGADQTESLPTQPAERGFTLAELVILIAVIGILSVMAVPSFLRYYQAATLKSGAQQFVTMINQARELAIKENGNVCVKLSSPTQMTYALNTCTGTAWVGAGTDAAGNINLPTSITATTSANPIFNY